MAKLVAFDTNISGWAIRELPGVRDNLVSRCKQLVRTLEESGYTIIIPAPVLGELLAPIPVTEQPILHDKIAKVARIYPFDVIAAEIYAEMMYKYYNAGNGEDLKQWAKDGGIPRQKVKIDYMIVAIAKACSVDYLYTDDDGLRKFATPYLTVISVPNKLYVEPRPSVKQEGLFDLFLKNYEGEKPNL